MTLSYSHYRRPSFTRQRPVVGSCGKVLLSVLVSLGLFGGGIHAETVTSSSTASAEQQESQTPTAKKEATQDAVGLKESQRTAPQTAGPTTQEKKEVTDRSQPDTMADFQALFSEQKCQILLNRLTTEFFTNRASSRRTVGQRADGYDAMEWMELMRFRAVCLYLNQRLEEMDIMLQEILNEDMQHELPPYDTPNGVLRRFSELKIEMLRKVKALEQARQQSEQSDAEGDVQGPQKRWVKAVMLTPFGIPQRITGNTRMANLHAVTQSVGIAINVGAYWMLQGLRDDDGFVSDVETEERYGRLWDAHLVGLGIFAISYGISAFDGFLRYDDPEQAEAE